MLVFSLLVIVVVGALVYFIYPEKVIGPSDKAQIEALAETLITAILQGDKEALDETLDDEFVFDRSDTVMTRSQFIRDIVKGDLWAKLSDQRELEVTGDVAFLTAPFDANIVIDSQFMEVSGTMTIDFIKQEKTWSVRSIRIMPTF
jgi:ketosteroid isomerase-like protein